MHKLVEQAKTFSKNVSFSMSHREECKNEARVYGEILTILTETEIEQTRIADAERKKSMSLHHFEKSDIY